MDPAASNLRWAQALIEGLVQSGVAHAVISPGSRSTPLTLACAGHPDLRTWVVPDERSAAFLALGLSKAGGAPAAVVATSGSGPGNWYPAVIEAAYDGVPLLLLSADRPEPLQACGANQTIDQTQLFGKHVRAFFALPDTDDSEAGLRHASTRAAQAVDRSRWPHPGPVHVNVPLREPLVPAGGPVAGSPGPRAVAHVRYPRLVPVPADLAELGAWLSGRRGLIVCGRGAYGEGFPAAVAELARRLACPVLADPLSGVRFGDHDRSLILSHYDTFLRAESFDAGQPPERVLQFGAVPTSKALQQYIAGLGVATLALVIPHGPWQDPAERSERVLYADPELLCQVLARLELQPAPADWSEAFLAQERRVASRLDGSGNLPLEARVLKVLGRCLPERATLFCGNSMVIRDVDSFLGGGDRALRILGNRGASGIDGNVSTVLGIAAAGGGPVVGLVGDLALYHDMNGLLAARDLDATLVVFNNGGGAIFGYLPQRNLPDFERYWLTPTGLDIAQVARLYGLAYHRAGDAEAFEAALERSLGGPGVDIIEVVIDREESVARHQAYWGEVDG